jgi:hypothetical protein
VPPPSATEGGAATRALPRRLTDGRRRPVAPAAATANGGGGDDAAGGGMAARSPVSSGLVRVIRDELKIERERYRQSDALMGGPPAPWDLDDRPGSNALALARLFGPGGREEVLVEVDLDAQLDDPSDGDGEGGSDGSGPDEDEGPGGGAGGGGGGGVGGGELPPVRFTVSIAKGGRLLAFECESSGEFVQILHVSLEDLEPDEDDDDDDDDDQAEGAAGKKRGGGGGGNSDDDDDDDDDPTGLGGAPPYAGPVFAELDETLQQAFSDFLEERGVDADLALYLMELVQDKLEVEYCRWLGSVAGWLEA